MQISTAAVSALREELLKANIRAYLRGPDDPEMNFGLDTDKDLNHNIYTYNGFAKILAYDGNLNSLKYTALLEIQNNFSHIPQFLARMKYKDELLSIMNKIIDSIQKEDNKSIDIVLSTISADGVIREYFEHGLQAEEFYEPPVSIIQPYQNKKIALCRELISFISQQFLAEPGAAKVIPPSFKYAHWNSDSDKLADFRDALDSFILNINLPAFKKVFSGETITSPIAWIGDGDELCYLIKKLFEEGKLSGGKGYKLKWVILKSCFRLENDRPIPENIKTYWSPGDSLARQVELDNAIGQL